MVKWNANLIWENKACASFWGQPLFQSDKTTVKWSVRNENVLTWFQLGCGWHLGSVTHSKPYHVNLSLKGQHSKRMLGVLGCLEYWCTSRWLPMPVLQCLALQFLSSLTSHSVLTSALFPHLCASVCVYICASVCVCTYSILSPLAPSPLATGF